MYGGGGASPFTRALWTLVRTPTMITMNTCWSHKCVDHFSASRIKRSYHLDEQNHLSLVF